MPTHRQIRTAIAGVLTALPNMGPVHAYERFAKRSENLRALYGDGTRLFGWHVRRTARRITRDAPALAVDTWELRGLLSLADARATELDLDDYADAVLAALLADSSLGGTVDTLLPAGEEPPRLMESGPVMFGGVLCHRVRVRLVTQTELEAVDTSTLDAFVTFHADYDVPPHEDGAEHLKWLAEPPDQTTSAPDATDEVRLEQEP